ncbi:MAG: AMP-binding protein [Propionivibrio sp.]|nr:AMP-binding protein [Propionivibrio sp.]
MAGKQLADGYLGAHELTASRLGTAWMQSYGTETGDLTSRDATGCFHCLGRIDNQVPRAGLPR